MVDSMNEGHRMTSTAADEAPAALDAAIQSEVTAGAALRRAREARGLHIAALAATLKVPQSKLEALEGDRYKELPDATFARALARSMCRALKIEAEPVLAMLPRGGGEASLDRVTPGLNQPFRERAASQEPMVSLALLKNPVLLGGAALLVAALAVYLVPASVVDDVTHRFQREPESASTGTPTSPAGTTTEPVQVEAPTVSATAPVATDAASASVAASGAATSALGTTAQTSATTGPAAGTSAGTSPTTPATTAPATTATTPAAGTATTPSAAATTATTPATNAGTTAGTTAATTAGTAAPTTAAPAGAGLLRVRATGDTWVEVVDSQGQTLLSRLLRTGEQVDLNGTAPLKLRVGNVSGTELVFRGKSVDLAARARDNVARLELN
jgi:cytoskeleton protein RodZ